MEFAGSTFHMVVVPSPTVSHKPLPDPYLTGPSVGKLWLGGRVETL